MLCRSNATTVLFLLDQHKPCHQFLPKTTLELSLWSYSQWPSNTRLQVNKSISMNLISSNLCIHVWTEEVPFGLELLKLSGTMQQERYSNSMQTLCNFSLISTQPILLAEQMIFALNREIPTLSLLWALLRVSMGYNVSKSRCPISWYQNKHPEGRVRPTRVERQRIVEERCTCQSIVVDDKMAPFFQVLVFSVMGTTALDPSLSRYPLCPFLIALPIIWIVHFPHLCTKGVWIIVISNSFWGLDRLSCDFRAPCYDSPAFGPRDLSIITGVIKSFGFTRL